MSAPSPPMATSKMVGLGIAAFIFVVIVVVGIYFAVTSSNDAPPAVTPPPPVVTPTAVAPPAVKPPPPVVAPPAVKPPPPVVAPPAVTPPPHVVTPPPPAATPPATSAATSYTKAGYKPLPLSSLPAKFKLKAQNGRYWGDGGDTVTDGGTAIVMSADSPTDLYKASGTGMYRLKTASNKYIRHSGYVMFQHDYSAGNIDFPWQLMLKDGTTNQVIVWNPFPSPGGMYVQGAGGRQRIGGGEPWVYTMEPVPTTGVSTYTSEPTGFNVFSQSSVW